MPPTPHGFLGRRRACHGGLSWAGLGASEGPKSTPEGAKRAPRRAPGASWAPGRPQVATKAALRPPLGGSWGALGALLGSSWDLLGRSRPLLGRSWGSFWPPGGLLLELFGSLFEAPLENSEHLENLCFFNGFSMVFASPGGPKSSPNGSEIALARVFATSWRSLGASRRCLGVSWRPLGALGASWAPLGALL